MRRAIKKFVARQVATRGDNGKCLDVGALDVNGNLRAYFRDYTGLDMRDGKNVDIVANGHSIPFTDGFFSTVVCAEMLEHDMCFWETVAEMKRVLKVGGSIIITAPSIGFGLHNHPSDYFRFTEEGIKSLISEWCEDIESLHYDGTVMVAGRKI